MHVHVSHSRSTFAVDGDKLTVNSEVEFVMKDFHSSQKPVGYVVHNIQICT